MHKVVTIIKCPEESVCDDLSYCLKHQENQAFVYKQ